MKNFSDQFSCWHLFVISDGKNCT